MAGAFTRNTHALAYGGVLLWHLTFDREGSPWDAAALADGTADIYLTRLDVAPMYSRLRYDGRALGGYGGFETGAVPAHAFPPQPGAAFVSYRYYALTLSVGLQPGSTSRTLELQEFQPPPPPPGGGGRR